MCDKAQRYDLWSFGWTLSDCPGIAGWAGNNLFAWMPVDAPTLRRIGRLHYLPAAGNKQLGMPSSIGVLLSAPLLPMIVRRVAYSRISDTRPKDDIGFALEPACEQSVGQRPASTKLSRRKFRICFWSAYRGSSQGLLLRPDVQHGRSRRYQRQQAPRVLDQTIAYAL